MSIFTAKPKEREVANKVIYVSIGDVIELPCDYHPGKVANLYSIFWSSGFSFDISPTSLPSGHLFISPENYSLFVNVTELSQVQLLTYSCLVLVRGSNTSGRFSCISSSRPFSVLGAEITLEVRGRSCLIM